MKEAIVHTTTGGFAAIATAFVAESLQNMIPWLIVSCAVILCDLLFGVRKSMLMGEKVRFSRAIRATMGKMVTYFAFVCMVCMISVASHNEYPIDVYSCLLVCFIEGCSIVGNILKPKGININLIGALGGIDGMAHIIVCQNLIMWLSKFFGIVPLWEAIIITVVIFILKEVYDKYCKKTEFSIKDIICDCVGLALGVLTLIL